MSIIFLEKNGFLNMTNIAFVNNIVEDDIINLFYVSFITMTNVVFQKNNMNTKEDRGTGGSLRSMNSHSRFFQNIIIIDSISNQKAFGLRLVDDDFDYYQIFINQLGDLKVKKKKKLMFNKLFRLSQLNVYFLTIM